MDTIDSLRLQSSLNDLTQYGHHNDSRDFTNTQDVDDITFLDLYQKEVIKHGFLANISS